MIRIGKNKLPYPEISDSIIVMVVPLNVKRLIFTYSTSTTTAANWFLSLIFLMHREL